MDRPRFPPRAARLPWPAPWEEIFGRQAPIIVEVGFGGGHFLIDLARRNPEANVVGAEIAAPSLRRAVRKKAVHQVSNLFILQGNASLTLWALFPPQAIDALYVNFPDPWPKKRHFERRLVQPRFLELAASRLRPGAVLDIATDHSEYADHIESCLRRSQHFASRHPEAWVADRSQAVRTKYELAALAVGRQPRYFSWRRNSRSVLNDFPLPEEQYMPHIILRTPLSLSQIGAAFEPYREDAADVHIRYITLYESADRKSLLVITNIAEEPLAQRVALILFQRPSGDLKIGLHEVGYPRATPGVQLALSRFADWVVNLHRDTVVVHRQVMEMDRFDATNGDEGEAFEPID